MNTTPNTPTKSKSWWSKELILKLPKTDLHVHIDGSIRLPTLIELAKEQNVELPSYDEEGLRETVFKERYNSLEEYLKGFKYTVATLQTPDALERVSYELAMDNFHEGVRYIEPRFAPQLHINSKMNMEDVLLSVHRGLKLAKEEINAKEEIRNGKEPPFEYGIIVCALRMFHEGFASYYADILRVHPYTQRKKVYAMASLELAQAAVNIRREYGIPIVGFDLAGQENGYPAEDHVDAYSFCHKNFLKKTVHAGEAYGPESIFQAITDLHADRIGHGYHLFSTWLIDNKNIQDKHRYVEELAQYIADRRITIEVCLSSNVQTNPNLKKMAHHTFGEMVKKRISATLCTDNRTVSNTTVTKEILLAIENFHLRPRDLKHLIIYGFKRSFFPLSYIEKRNYVRNVLDYYEKIEQEFSIQPH
ncbi:MAG: adenosine deaminase family protein [Planctomycetota bacterium]|nr:MAG: adenosine deaminase family protein [Planctomycetota bacterium]